MKNVLRKFHFKGLATFIGLLLGTSASLQGESSMPEPGNADMLPQTVVTARKEPESLLRLPLSVTAVPVQPSAGGNFYTVRDASAAAPSVFMNEFTARALSNPFFRGIGGSPVNPGVTTYIDGVPQLNSYSSSIQLLDVGQVEFIRGPQGALFGRNTPGGLIHITSRRPTPSWSGDATALYGNYDAHDFRAHVSGPIDGDLVAFGLGAGYEGRNGYTRNRFNGEDVDDREAWFGKGQLLFAPGERVEGRLIINAEQDRDGDYALGDLSYIRNHPWRVRRDFAEGYNDRDILSPTLQLSLDGERVKLESITGYVYWKTDGLTDLDYGVASPSNFFLNATRRNTEQQDQFTQEFRLASDPDQPIDLGEPVKLSWQSGVFLFHRGYEQETRNDFAAPLSMLSGTTESELEDTGVGIYGQVRAQILERLEASAGLRFDVEDKSAVLMSSTAPTATPDDTFTEVSPQFGLVYHVLSNHFAYASVSRGYKAGGFNPPPAGVLPAAGSEIYDTEHSWNYEVGYKLREFSGRLTIAVAFFYTDWEDLQLNQQYPGTAGQFFIGNAGSGVSKGIELEAQINPIRWVDLFGGVSIMEAEFGGGSTAFNANLNADEHVGGNDLPYAPEFKAHAGTELRWQLRRKLTLFARGQVTVFGDFQYDASNAAGQSSFDTVEFRAGIRNRNWFIEGWAMNAFGTEYVPIAIPYAQLGAPSGYVGEMGAPATFGLRGGLFF